MNFSQYSSLKVLVKIIINELNMMSSMVFRKPICNSVRNNVKFYKKKEELIRFGSVFDFLRKLD